MTGSIIRPANLLLTGFSFLKSSLSGNPGVNGMPVSVGTELTNNCNLHCPECSCGSGHMQRERGFMDPELFNKIVGELRPYLYNINLYFQGEPMLHPQFFSILRSCINIHTVVSTNGHFLTEQNTDKIVRSGLNKLIISIDGTDQETYSAYRKGGSLNRVLEGLKNVTKARKRHNSDLKIEIQFIVNSLNEHQITSIRELANREKVSLKLKSMQILNKENIRSWLPGQERFRRYEIKDGEYAIKSSLSDRCVRLWFNPVITWDGKVIPCCFDKDAEHIMGDLNNDSFREIWNGSKYRIFRKSILSGRHMIEICRNCTSGLRGAI